MSQDPSAQPGTQERVVHVTEADYWRIQHLNSELHALRTEYDLLASESIRLASKRDELNAKKEVLVARQSSMMAQYGAKYGVDFTQQPPPIVKPVEGG